MVLWVIWMFDFIIGLVKKEGYTLLNLTLEKESLTTLKAKKLD
jgi:hypothetical protein